jgi:hypothetical protein
MTARRYALVFALATALLGAGVALFNLAVDPYGVFGTNWLLPDSPLTNVRVRDVRIYLERPDTPNVLVFGSSRAMGGLPADDVERVVPGARVHVFGFPAASISDHLAVLRRMMALRPMHAPATVILLLDADLFGREPPIDTLDMQHHPVVSGANSLHFYFTYLFAVPSRAARRAALESAAMPAFFRASPAVATGQGWVPADVAAPEAFRLETAPSPPPPGPALQAPVANPPANNTPAAPPASAVAAPPVSAVPAEQILRRRRGGGLPLPQDVDRALDQLRAFVALCDAAGIRLVAIMSPLRAPYRAALGNAEIDAVVARIAQVVPVWTFDEAGARGMDGFWGDPSHFTPELGRLMLARALGLAAPSDPRVVGRFVDALRPEDRAAR